MSEKTLSTQEKAKIQKASPRERFTDMVMKEFGSSVGAPQVTDYQRQLIQGYFICIDRALKTAEDERLRKNNSSRDHKYDNDLPITWENVNLNDLALDIIHYARVGLDMMQPNHLFPIPYKNNKAQKYDVNLMPGYNGIRYVAEKYALTPPKNVIVELVHETDTFRPIKKDSKNQVESYEFVINNPFDRGKVVGGFGYIAYDDPEKNELIIMTLHDFEKRKPQYASANFWGGTATEWKDGKKETVEKEGWFEEMCVKTIKREVYGAKHIPRDPRKIDDDYQYMKAREARLSEMVVSDEVAQNANRTMIDVQQSPSAPAEPAALPQPVERSEMQIDTGTGEVLEQSAKPEKEPEPKCHEMPASQGYEPGF